jgi:uncharacterized membrane protein YhhN
MDIWLILALLFAGLEALAVWKGWRQIEFVTKPAVMLFLFLWLLLGAGLQSLLLWFGIGIVFSLAGDVLLLVPRDRMFIPGLIAFLLTHICYLIGFQQQLIHPTAWTFMLLFFILLNAARLLRRIATSLRLKGQAGLVYPVIVYGLVISLMLFAAMSTFFDETWKTNAALSVTAGAFLFWISDLMLAWNKFVSPLQSGRIVSILAYHLGQISLIAGVISQFS